MASSTVAANGKTGRVGRFSKNAFAVNGTRSAAFPIGKIDIASAANSVQANSQIVGVEAVIKSESLRRPSGDGKTRNLFSAILVYYKNTAKPKNANMTLIGNLKLKMVHLKTQSLCQKSRLSEQQQKKKNCLSPWINFQIK